MTTARGTAQAGARRVLDAVASVAPELPGILERWSATNSGSGNPAGVTAALTLVALRAERLGAGAETVPLGSGGPPALTLTRRPDAPLTVLLVGHCDTVFGPGDPFQVPDRPAPGVMRGPGVADMKGGLLVMLTALEAFERAAAPRRVGWRVLVTPDEEVGSPRSAPLLARAAAGADVGLVFEPAVEGHLVRRRAGRGVWRLDVRGRSAHAGRDPGAGRNAVTALADLVGRVERMAADIPGLRVNVARLEGGGATNVVPDRAGADLEIRLDGARAGTAWADGLERARREVEGARDVSVAAIGRVHRPPLDATPARAALLAAFRDAAGEPDLDWRDVGGSSDANLLGAAGLPCLDGLGPRGGGMHTAEEWVDLASLGERAAAAARFLAALESGGEPR